MSRPWPNLTEQGLAVLKVVDAANEPIGRAAIAKALGKAPAHVVEPIARLREHGFVYDVERPVQRATYAPLVGLTEKGQRAARGESPSGSRITMIRRAVARVKSTPKPVEVAPPPAQVVPKSLAGFRGIQHPPIPAAAARPEGMPAVDWAERIRFTSCTSGRAA